MTPEIKRITEAFLLGLVVWREARGEPPEAKVAVACSVLNRVANPKWWGTDVSTVIGKPFQYSSMTDPHDAQLTKFPTLSDSSWIESLQVAIDVLDGNRCIVPNLGADSYHDKSIAAPSWAKRELMVGQIGGLFFYNTDGDHPDNNGTEDNQWPNS
jgi:N-acetylmuramoyl-L-alanine amidase